MISLLVNAGAGETRIALLKDGRLEDFQIEREGEAMLAGNIYLGRVTKVTAAMQAAFVDIGEAQAGFLALREARHLSDKDDPGISDCVREGQAIAVQVIREGQGEKGPQLTTKLALAPELRAASQVARSPVILERAPLLLDRMLRDLPAHVARIAIDDARRAEAARGFCRQARPDLLAKIETVREPFDDALEDAIALLFAPRVSLDNGGWIAIETTEGFTAIDVNSGGFAASGGREETALAVNLEAAQEIGRQVRLRGIGGLIVTDFIQMGAPAAIRLVESVLTQSLGGDAPTDIILSRTGLAVITRKRTRPPLSRFSESCMCCAGAGSRPTAETVALAVLRAAEASARAAPGRAITVRAAPEVTAWLAAHREQLTRRGLARLALESVAGARETFDVATH